MATWTSNPAPNANHNSRIACVNGHNLEVYSDHMATEWIVVVDGAELFWRYYSRHRAMQEAENAALYDWKAGKWNSETDIGFCGGKNLTNWQA